MTDNRFWRIVAIAALAVGAYIGHGLHSPSVPSLPPLISAAKAGGGVSTDDRVVFAQDNDGKTIHVYIWGPPKGLAYFGSVSAK